MYLVIYMNYFKLLAGLRGEVAALALICLVLVLIIIILTIVKKLKDK